MRYRKTTWLVNGIEDNKHGITQPEDLLSTTQQQRFNKVSRALGNEIRTEQAKHKVITKRSDYIMTGGDEWLSPKARMKLAGYA